MADVDYVIVFGSSNVAGFAAGIDEVSAAVFVRWAGLNAPPLPWSRAATRRHPYHVTVPGVSMWTPRRPWSVSALRVVNGVPTSTDVPFDGAALTPDVGTWFYIAHDPVVPAWSSSTTYVLGDLVASGDVTYRALGTHINSPPPSVNWEVRGAQGQLRRVTATALNQVTTNVALDPVPAVGSGIRLITDSCTVLAAGTTRQVINTINTIPGGAANGVAGRYALFFGISGMPPVKITASGAAQVTLEVPLGAIPTEGTGFIVLTGANASEGLASMQPPNAVLQDLTFYEDHAPAYFTGLDYNNYDVGTPFQTCAVQVVHAVMPWDSSIAYQFGSLVLHLGLSYRCDRPAVAGESPSAAPYAPTTVDGDIDAPNNRITEVGHSFVNGNAVQVSSTGGFPTTTPAGQINGTVPLYIVNAAANTFELSLTPGGAVIDITGDTGGATLTWTRLNKWTQLTGAPPEPTINTIPELAFHLRSRLKSLHILQLGISASMISPFFIGSNTLQPPASVSLPFGAFAGPLHDVKSLDFHPTSPSSLFTMLANAITSMNALITTAGNRGRCRGIFVNLWDNDPVDVERFELFIQNTSALRQAIRDLVSDQAAPFIMSGPSHYGGSSAGRALIYEMLHKVAALDPARTSAVADTRNAADGTGGIFGAGDYAFDNLHLSAQGQTKLAGLWFDTWDPVYTRITEDTAAVDSMALDICNMALSYIGDLSIFSLDPTVDQSVEARLCAQHYPSAFKDVRERHHWAFSTATVALAPATKDPLRTDWAYAYVLPADLETPIRVVPPGPPSVPGELPALWRFPSVDSLPSDVTDPPYEIESGTLYTNVASAGLKYTKHINSRTIVPYAFRQAVARKLVALLANPLVRGTEGAQMAERFEALARIETGEAGARDASKQQKLPDPTRMPWNR